MATARSQEAFCSLVPYSTLDLEQKEDHCTHYRGLVVSGDTLIVLNFTKQNLGLHRIPDGKLLATFNRPKLDPLGICLISNTQVAVIWMDCKIEILSFESTGDTGAIRHVRHVRTLDVTTRLEFCDAVANVKLMDQLVVSGRNKGMMCWCVVSLKDGHVDRHHEICKGWRDSHMAIMNNMVYISCDAGPVGPNSHEVSGVYAYDINNPHTRKFLYQHCDLKRPWGLTVDTRGFIFVCSGDSPHIHQLTDRGELVIIHELPKALTPRDIFYEDQQRVLYITSLQSNKITRFKLDYHGFPIEILNMDKKSIQLFEEALKDGKEPVYNIRVMVVGHLGVGKTTLIKRLLGKEVKISERQSTEGIDVHVNCCDVSLSTGKWTRHEKDLEQDYQLHRLARVLKEQQLKKKDSDSVEILPQGETTGISTSVTEKEYVIIRPQEERPLKSHEGDDVAEDKGTEVLYRRSPQQDFGKDLLSTASQQDEFPLVSVEKMRARSETYTFAMLKLLQENADILEQDKVKNSQLTMWDFAGQYAYYTTHQTFLTRRAIYLLVSDISKQVTNLVADECYFDSEGVMKCKVHELIEVWLNSIHSCAESPESGIPPVILVGTHVDKISQNQSPAKGKEFETQTTHTTSTSVAAATNEQPRTLTTLGAMKKFFQPWKTEGIVEVTPVISMTGAYALPAEDDIKEPRKSRLWPWRKKRVKTNVGVDAEKGSHHEICERYFKEIRSYLQDKPTRFHLVDEDFAIDNTVIDSRLEDLKRKIVEVASQQPYWGEVIPARWLPLEQKLMMLKDAGMKVILRKDVETINKEGAVRIEKSEELDLFLTFLHETGTIIYFSIETLRDNIVLDPEWWIDALKSLINAQPNPLKIPADNDSQSNSPAENGTQLNSPADNDSQSKSPAESYADNDSQSKSPAESDADNGTQSNNPSDNDSQSKSPADSDADNDSQSKSSADSDADNDSQSQSPAGSDVTQKWSDFKEKGILTMELVDAVWTKEKYPELHAHKDHILLIMEQLNIIAKPRVFIEHGEEKVENYFLTPCMLRQESPREVISPEQAEQDPRIVSTSVLCWIFTGKFLPPPIFHRLLAACVARWPVAKKEKSENLIFCGCCIFDLDLFHRLTLHCRNHIVFARITKMVIDEVKTPDAKLCTRVRKFIDLNLSKITSYLSQNLQYELRTTLSPPSQRISDGDNVEFGPPFQMWFADEGQDPDAAITNQHMNYARLNIALTSVCANAMREILLTHVPEPHMNIYQAILAKKDILTSRTQGRPALLNQDQSRVVFLDPFSRYVTAVDQFDISLLYTLVRNVSTVPPPITDWNIEPPDQPFRDKSLGASVARIRLYRNLITGHSTDGKISKEDFEEYWNKIKVVLHDIEDVCRTSVYTQEIDKQQRHVITIYEAC